MTMAGEVLARQVVVSHGAGRRLSATRELNLTKYHFYTREAQSIVGAEQRVRRPQVQFQGNFCMDRGETVTTTTTRRHKIPELTIEPTNAVNNMIASGKQRCEIKRHLHESSTSDNLSLNSARSSSQSLESSSLLNQPGRREVWRLSRAGPSEERSQASDSKRLTSPIVDHIQAAGTEIQSQTQILAIPPQSIRATPVGSSELPLTSLPCCRPRHESPTSKPTIEEQLRQLFNAVETPEVDMFKQQRRHERQVAGWSPGAMWASGSSRLNQNGGRDHLGHQSGVSRDRHQVREADANEPSPMEVFMAASRRAAALTNTLADKEARILQWIHECNRARLAPGLQ